MNRTVLALAIACASVFAHAEIVDIAWNADGKFGHATAIPARGILEVCGKLPVGLTVDWSFTSSAAIESNVHFHEGKQVTYPAKHAAAPSVTDSLIVAAEQDYCWMWSNRTLQPVQVDVQLLRK